MSMQPQAVAISMNSGGPAAAVAAPAASNVLTMNATPVNSAAVAAAAVAGLASSVPVPNSAALVSGSLQSAAGQPQLVSESQVLDRKR